MLELAVGLAFEGWPLNFAISLCLFENPCESWKKILAEEV